MFLVYTHDPNPQQLRSSLYAISVIILSLYQKILPKILQFIQDNNVKVQFAACDALYNLIKVCREAIIPYNFTNVEGEHKTVKAFDMICDEISIISGSKLSEIKEWGVKIDELLKDVIYQTEAYMLMLRWIEVLHSMKNTPIFNFVPELLPILLNNIGNRSTLGGAKGFETQVNYNKDVWKKSLDLLMKFLKEFECPQFRNVYLDTRIIKSLLNYLLSKDSKGQQIFLQKDMSKVEALIWLRDFLLYFSEDLQTLITEEQSLYQERCAFIMRQQSTKTDEEKKDESFMVSESQQEMEDINESNLGKDPEIEFNENDNNQNFPNDSKNIIDESFREIFPKIIRVIVKYAHSVKDEYRIIVQKINETLLSIINMTMQDKSDIQYIFKELKDQFMRCDNAKLNLHKDDLDLKQIKLILLVSKVLELMCMLSQKKEQYLRKIIKKLIKRIYDIGDWNQTKMNQVITVLCSQIQQERVFLEFAKILRDLAPDHLDFVEEMIEALTITIATNKNQENFIAKLRGKRKTEYVDSKEKLFFLMFKTWINNPVSAITLCLMSRNYELAYNLIFRFTQMEIDKSKLIHFGNLIQLIESPSFISLRIEMTHGDIKAQYLVKTIQGILMIMPISKSFNCLKARLDCIKMANYDMPLTSTNGQQCNIFGEDYKFEGPYRMDDLLEMFDRNLIKMKEFHLKQRLAILENTQQVKRHVDKAKTSTTSLQLHPSVSTPANLNKASSLKN